MNTFSRPSDKIKAATLELCSRHAIDALSEEEIAAHAGVSIGRFRYHYADKAQLLIELLREPVTAWDLATAMAGDAALEEGLRSILEHHIAHPKHWRLVAQLMHSDSGRALLGRSGYDEARRGFFQRLSDLFFDLGEKQASDKVRQLDLWLRGCFELCLEEEMLDANALLGGLAPLLMHRGIGER